MKRLFVLDENIIISAHTGRDDRGEPDPTCLALLLAINTNCHSIVVTYSGWARYSRQLKARRMTGATTIRVLAVISQLLTNRDKDTRWLSEQECRPLPDLRGLPGVDEGDYEFVCMAASVEGSVLVTMDGPLREVLAARGAAATYGFIVVTPTAALPLAGPDLG